VQGWRYWAKAGVVLLTLVVAAGVICGAVLLGWLRYRLPPQYFYLSDASQIGPLFVHMCIVAPLREETIYRLALCIPMAAWAGPRAAIVVSGVLFAAMHVLNGNPAPENLIGGFLLAWAFLRSETILVPLALHSVGNMLAWLCQTVIFLWMR
jgi:membrane protease YdiL (CAAX protease family)